MELLEGVGLLACTDVLDRLSRDPIDGKRRAAARVAVELREDHAGHTQCGVEALRDLHCFLAGHAVGHEQNFIRPHRILQAAQLVHHLLVDLQAARGVEYDDAIPLAARQLESRTRDLHDVLRRAIREHGNAEFAAERFELVDRRGTVHVRRDHPNLSPFRLQSSRELRRGRRLSGALQTDHHHDRRRDARELESLATLAEHRRELVEDDLHQLLRGTDRAQLRHSDRPLGDAFEELAGQLEVDVGLEQDTPHVAEAVFDVGFGQRAAAAELRERGFKLGGELVEHEP